MTLDEVQERYEVFSDIFFAMYREYNLKNSELFTATAPIEHWLGIIQSCSTQFFDFDTPPGVGQNPQYFVPAVAGSITWAI